MSANDVPFGGVGISECDELHGDCTGSVSSSSSTKGLNSVIQCRFDAPFASLASSRLHCSYYEFWGPAHIFFDRFWVCHTRRFFSSCGPLRPSLLILSWIMLDRRMMFKYNCMTDLPTSGTLANFSFLNPIKLGCSDSLKTSNRWYSFCSNCSPKR